jgi:hypothetical protein
MTQEGLKNIMNFLDRFKHNDTNQGSKGSNRATHNRNKDDFDMLLFSNNQSTHLAPANEDCHHSSSHDTNCHDHHD